MIDLKLGTVGGPVSSGRGVELLIAGGGPAAYTAGVYAGRYRLDTVLLAGHQPGGQLALTHAIENFPGHLSAKGDELASAMRKQAESTGTEIVEDRVEKATAADGEILVTTSSGAEYRAKALIIATGAAPRQLGVPGEKEFYGQGVSYCGTCDAPFFRDRHVLAVGGGDTAIKEALYLTEYAAKVTLVHRRDELRAEPILQEQLESNEKIDVRYSTLLKEIRGSAGPGGGVRSVLLETTAGGEEELELDGVFVFIGWDPATAPFSELVELTDTGEVHTTNGIYTNRGNVFAAGDVRETELRQVVTAAADGAHAAFAAFTLLREQ
jgi:thioredoxin reductase (NADPH)